MGPTRATSHAGYVLKHPEQQIVDSKTIEVSIKYTKSIKRVYLLVTLIIIY